MAPAEIAWSQSAVRAKAFPKGELNEICFRTQIQTSTGVLFPVLGDESEVQAQCQLPSAISAIALWQHRCEHSKG
jgi:hypothetical protein